MFAQNAVEFALKQKDRLDAFMESQPEDQRGDALTLFFSQPREAEIAYKTHAMLLCAHENGEIEK